MKNIAFISILFLLIGSNTIAQSIRKSFTELTENEKIELKNALYEMRDINGDGGSDSNPDDDDLFLDLATFHSNFFDFNGDNDPNNNNDLDIHFNLPDQINIQIFFGWHRYQMFEMEQALQEVNPKLSLAYWNSSVEKDLTFLTDSLFGTKLLGDFNSDWVLGRALNSGTDALPDPETVAQVQSTIDFANNIGPGRSDDGGYSNQMERLAPHIGVHIWTGGVMPDTNSPADPIFYFHHSWIDKLWKDWEDANPGTQSSFIIQSMIRYDGTYTFNGTTLPLINPNDITDSRSLGIFYAENGLAVLDNYIVSNSHNPIENFFYQYTIEAKDDFIIPNGTISEIESMNTIILKPGFTAESGSTFTAKIGNIASPASRLLNDQNRYNPFTFDSDIIKNVYEPEFILGNDTFESINSQVFPNPFRNKFTLNFDHKITNSTVEIYDTNGRLVFQKRYNDSVTIIIDNLGHLSVGIYSIKVISDQGLILNTKIIKK